MSQFESGLKGEALAEAYLKRQGYSLLKKRFRSRHGEVDLIAKRGNLLYFIEVKYRPQGRLGSGIGAITPQKQRRLLDAVHAYLGKSPGPWRLAYLEITRAGILFREDVLHEQ